MNVAEYIKAHAAEGMNMHRLARLTGISYSTLHPHVTKGKPVELGTARKLEEFSKGEMTAAEILGLAVPAPASTRAPKKAPARKKKNAA